MALPWALSSLADNWRLTRARKEETMPRPLFLHELDEMTSRGCDNSFCIHDHGAELFLTPLCHPGAGVYVEAMDDRLGRPLGGVLGGACWEGRPPRGGGGS